MTVWKRNGSGSVNNPCRSSPWGPNTRFFFINLYFRQEARQKLTLEYVEAIVVIREPKRLPRRRRGRRQEENELIFYQRNPRLSGSIRYTNGSKNVLKISMQWQSSISKVRIWSFLTLLFCRGRQRNVQRFVTHVHIVLLLKRFVRKRSRCRGRRCLLKLPIHRATDWQTEHLLNTNL